MKQGRQTKNESRIQLTDCPIHLDKSHCPNCYFNPSGEFCDYKDDHEIAENLRSYWISCADHAE